MIIVACSVRVGRAAHVDTANCRSGLAIDTRDRSNRRCVRLTVVGHAVTSDHHRRVRLADRISDRGIADIVVVGCASESPVVGSVRPGIGVRRLAHVYGADRGSRLAVHTRDRVRRRVRIAVIYHVVRRDHDRRIGL